MWLPLTRFTELCPLGPCVPIIARGGYQIYTDSGFNDAFGEIHDSLHSVYGWWFRHTSWWEWEGTSMWTNPATLLRSARPLALRGEARLVPLCIGQHWSVRSGITPRLRVVRCGRYRPGSSARPNKAFVVIPRVRIYGQTLRYCWSSSLQSICKCTVLDNPFSLLANFELSPSITSVNNDTKIQMANPSQGRFIYSCSR